MKSSTETGGSPKWPNDNLSEENRKEKERKRKRTLNKAILITWAVLAVLNYARVRALTTKRS